MLWSRKEKGNGTGGVDASGVYEGDSSFPFPFPNEDGAGSVNRLEVFCEEAREGEEEASVTESKANVRVAGRSKVKKWKSMVGGDEGAGGGKPNEVIF